MNFLYREYPLAGYVHLDSLKTEFVIVNVDFLIQTVKLPSMLWLDVFQANCALMTLVLATYHSF